MNLANWIGMGWSKPISLLKAWMSSSVESSGMRTAAGFPVIWSIENTRISIAPNTMKLCRQRLMI